MRPLALLGTCTVVALAACGTGSPPAQLPTQHGEVWIVADSYHAQNVAQASGAAGAEFGDGASLCTTQASFGPCDVSWCDDVGSGVTFHSAGTVSITGALAPIALHPEMGAYPDFNLTGGPLFTGTESLHVTATGAEVPAFEATFTPPTKPTITSPTAPPEQTAITVARASDFTFTWTGFATGTLHAAILGGPNASTQVDCTFDAAAGTGTIPAQALMMVPANGLTQFHMESIRESVVDAGDWAVTLRATTQAVWPDDTPAGGLISLQ